MPTTSSATGASDFIWHIGGVPFLDNTVDPTKTLTAIACKRRSYSKSAHVHLRDYLLPSNAHRIFQQYSISREVEIPWIPLPKDNEELVKAATAGIINSCSAWAPLFNIPKRYRMLTDGRISNTSVLIPQTIYLGRAAFSSTALLQETLVHEHAHVWLGFLSEAYDLQQPEAPNDYVLPSGTRGKSLRGVLLAAHFSAAAIQFHQSLNLGDRATSDRICYLRGYLDGCIQAATERPYLTSMGRIILERLQTFSRHSAPDDTSIKKEYRQ